jgi:hypothetical protein
LQLALTSESRCAERQRQKNQGKLFHLKTPFLAINLLAGVSDVPIQNGRATGR